MRPGGSGSGSRRPSQPSAALSAAMAGAVDLAAVKARADAQARAAEAPAPSAAESVVQVTEATLQSEVLDRSFQVPVLVVFFSARSQASATLIASLTPLVQKQNGAVVLAVVDVDADLRIAQAMQVQGIPTVMAVIGGQLVPGFEGALPEAQLQQFLTAVLEAGKEAGLAGAVAQEGPAEPQQPDDPRFDAAEEALAAGDYALAEERFTAILNAEPAASQAHADAKTALEQVRLLRRVSAGGEGVLVDADTAFVNGDVDTALRLLLDALPTAVGEEKDALRERLIEFFDLLGPEDERVPAARREMARTLF